MGVKDKQEVNLQVRGSFRKAQNAAQGRGEPNTQAQARASSH